MASESGPIVIDASALESVNYNEFFSDYFEAAGASSYLFYGGTVDTYYGRPFFMNGSQVGMTYASSENQVVWSGEGIAYEAIHYGTNNHAITGAVDSLSFSFSKSTDYTQTATARSELSGIVSDLLISNLDISAAQGSTAAYDVDTGTGNFVHALWDILGGAGSNATLVESLYKLLSLRAQQFIGTTGNDTYTGTAFDDIIEGNGGNDVIDGGDGVDRFVVNGSIADFEVSASALGYTVVGAEWTATLTQVELVVFDDGEINIAEAPTNLALSDTSVDENAKAGTVVGTLSAVDPNDDPLTYALSKESEFFAIEGDKLVVKKSTDYETATSHAIEVTVTDKDGNTSTRSFTIGVNDVNEKPTDLKLSKNTVKENVKVGTVVGKLSSSDVDAGDKVTYSLASGSSNYFKIVGDTLVVAKALDYETLKSHTVTLVATDKGGLTTSLKVKVGVTDTIDVLKGTDAANTIHGGRGVDHIYGNGGNDKLYGAAGSDKLYGGDGNDKLYGGSGNDILYGEDGNDTLFGESGSDKIYGGAGNDKIYGDSGNDTLHGGAGNDTLYGGVGNDKLYGGDGNDTLYGGAWGDVLDGGAGNDVLHGESGDDSLTGGFGNDTLYGGSGKDLLKGGAGNDKLFGESGSDRLYGGTGADKLYGGSGADTFIFLYKEESTTAASGRDTIYDFSSKQGDRIDLSGFDANSKVAGIQSFTFIGDDAFSGKAGELNYKITKGGNTHVFADLDGDKSADFAVVLTGIHELSKGDFLL